jgi:uncharacterized membrane protein YphA (DoxX/SURF4 family)
MQTALNSYAVLLLRVALGIMFLSHNLIYMLGTLTLTGAADYFVSIGLPRWLAYTTFIAEALGGLLMVLGIKTRWVALALSPILLGATWAQVSSLTSRRQADMTVSPIFTKPPGNACFPGQGSFPRRMSSRRPNGSKTTQSVARAGVCGKVMLGP